MLLVLLLLACSPSLLLAITPQEIMRETDSRAQYESAISTGEFRITDRFGQKVSTFKAYAKGEETSLIEFTSVAERGQKVLRTEGSIYLFYPDAQQLIRMQGAALRQGMLGSDISYEDMTGGKDRLSDYEIVRLEDELFSGQECYVLELTAKSRTIAYPKQKVWISKEHFIVMRGEYSTKSGRLLKTIEVEELSQFGSTVAASRTLIKDEMKSDSQTLLILTSLQTDIPIDDSIFSLQELSW